MSILYTCIVLVVTALAGAALLYIVARRFHVEEDERIEQIVKLLPGANCGGCGLKGCRDFATSCVSAPSLSGIFCPVGGDAVMAQVARIIGVDPSASVAKIAVLRCNGSCAARPLRFDYDGPRSCAVMASVASGDRGCSFGCLGCGDCVESCAFGALSISPDTGLPVIDSEKCTSCGKCVAKCPRHLIELRPRGRNDRRVWIACSSHDKGAVARKTCAASCIGCGKCAKVCPFGAISVTDNLAYIDSTLCKACGKCLKECPTGAILSNNVKQSPVEQVVQK